MKETLNKLIAEFDKIETEIKDTLSILSELDDDETRPVMRNICRLTNRLRIITNNKQFWDTKTLSIDNEIWRDFVAHYKRIKQYVVAANKILTKERKE